MLNRAAQIGVVTALLPALVLMLWPPVPASGLWALALIAIAAAVAAFDTLRRNGFELPDAIRSGLLTAVVAAVVIGPLMTLMLRLGPAGWVPSMESHALTPASRLDERRHLAAEPYFFVLLIGIALALILLVVAVRSRARRHAAPSAAAGPGPIELGEV